MKMSILKSKAGVTVLEGIIALGLLAMVMAGSFGVLLSVSRQTTQPDMYEEMMLAVEKASDMLKDYPAVYVGNPALSRKIGTHQLDMQQNGTCEVANKKLDCLLPPICGAGSSFTFDWESEGSSANTLWQISTDLQTLAWEGAGNAQMYVNDGTSRLNRDNTYYGGAAPTGHSAIDIPHVGVRFHIKCNGYEL